VADLAEYEWIEEGKPYREWLVPAALINPRMGLRVVVDDEEAEPPAVEDERWNGDTT